MSEVEIVVPKVEEWREYRELRLQALREEPQAFGSSYEEEAGERDQFWIDRLKGVQKGRDKWMYVAKDEGKMVGMIRAYREKGEKVSHLVNIASMYVSAEARGKGTGRALFKALMIELKSNLDIVKISLHVTSEQFEAQKLYMSEGFEKLTLLEKEINVRGTYYDTYLMSKMM